MTNLYTNTDSKKTRISYGVQNAANAILRLVSKSKDEIDICGNYTVLSAAIGDEVFKKILRDAKGRGIKFKICYRNYKAKYRLLQGNNGNGRASTFRWAQRKFHFK